MKEKQIDKQAVEEMANILYENRPYKDLWLEDAQDIAEALYNAGYRKQSVGEWVFEARHYYDDYGDLIVYATARCSKCGKNYHGNSTVWHERYERPETLGYHEEWEIDAEPLKEKALQSARERKDLLLYCPYCGAKMKGGME